MELLGNLAYKKVFATNTIYRMEVTESVIVHFLMDKFVGAVIYYDTDRKLNSIDKWVCLLFLRTTEMLIIVMQKVSQRKRSCTLDCFL